MIRKESVDNNYTMCLLKMGSLFVEQRKWSEKPFEEYVSLSVKILK